MRTACMILLGLCLGVGCDSSGIKRHTVSGKVTLDDTPVAEGNILFLPADTDSGADAGRIDGGHYTCQVTPGPKRVRITADRLIAGKVDPTGIPPHEQYIPSRYNKATTLKADVERTQELDFKLTTK
jgi:hypothetical protein